MFWKLSNFFSSNKNQSSSSFQPTSLDKQSKLNNLTKEQKNSFIEVFIEGVLKTPLFFIILIYYFSSPRTCDTKGLEKILGDLFPHIKWPLSTWKVTSFHIKVTSFHIKVTKNLTGHLSRGIILLKTLKGLENEWISKISQWF